MEQAIKLILAAGFKPDGETKTLLVKMPIPSDQDPSGWSRKISKVGGRLRFQRDGWKVTVGKRTTFFYWPLVVPIGMYGTAVGVGPSGHFKTSDVDAIAAFLAALSGLDGNAAAGDTADAKGK